MLTLNFSFKILNYPDILNLQFVALYKRHQAGNSLSEYESQG